MQPSILKPELKQHIMPSRKAKSTLALVAILCLAVLLPNPGRSAAAETPPPRANRIAVVEFNCDDGKLGKMLSEWAISVLMDRKDCSVIERIFLSKVLDEQKLSVSGLEKQETAAKFGELYGASHILIGTLGKIGSKYLLIVKTIDVNSSETVESKRGSTTELDNVPELLASLLSDKAHSQDPGQQKPPETKDVPRQPQANGTWEGFFQYDDSSRGYVKGSFTVHFKQHENGTITGEITEPWSQGFPTDRDEFHSSVENATFNAANNQIEFTKRYDHDGHTVDYHGTLVSSNVMTGRWNIGTYTGSWRAIRKIE